MDRLRFLVICVGLCAVVSITTLMYPLFRLSASNLQSAEMTLIFSTLFLWSVFLYAITQLIRFIKHSAIYLRQQKDIELLYRRIHKLGAREIHNTTETSGVIELISREIVNIFFTGESDDFDLVLELKQKMPPEKLANLDVSSANIPNYGFGFEGIPNSISDSSSLRVLYAMTDILEQLNIVEDTKDIRCALRDSLKHDNDAEQTIQAIIEARGIPKHIANSISQAILQL